GRVTLGRDVRCAATSQPYLGAAPPTPHWARYALLNHPQIPPKSQKIRLPSQVPTPWSMPFRRMWRKGGTTYTAVHVEGAGNVAKACERGKVSRLVHISGVGADPGSRAPYIRVRGEGELTVQRAFPRATILRPSVMFAADDAFLNALVRISQLSPVIPLIGGNTKLQPIHVSDVAAAVTGCLHDPATRGRIYELGGPEVHTLREIFDMILIRMGRRRVFLSVSFTLARPLARLAEMLPNAPLSVAQVDLLRHDNLPSSYLGGIAELGLVPRSLRDTLAELFGGGSEVDPARTSTANRGA